MLQISMVLFKPEGNKSPANNESTMNTLIKSLVLVLLVSNSLFAKIIESKKMSEILKDVTPDSLVVFDLDNTIMQAGQTLGSDQWFDHRIEQQKAKGIAVEEAVKTAVKEWEAINYKGTVSLVEKTTPSIVRSLQDDGIVTMGLTARPATFMNQSLKQLRQLNVPLYKNTISEEVITIKAKDVATFKEGLMSVGGNNKGTILVELMNKVDFHPERVLFVDDKVKNVTNVDKALNDVSIPSFAFRYGAADETVKAFDARLADFEYDYFVENGVVLSDRQAKQLMK